ncbi:hypothetical protein ACH4LS_02920 [Streptomyces luteogriseus]|uniref:hypothetical protein n=1 Tax=Streptomyces luteogriseus TaxID=68233 RepID=UPI00379B1895
MVSSPVRVPRRPRSAPAETAVPLCAALCRRSLALAMHAEGYDLDPSAPRQVSGDAEIARPALLLAVSVAVPWSLRPLPWPPLRTAVDALAVVRIAAVLPLSAVRAPALLTGVRVPLPRLGHASTPEVGTRGAGGTAGRAGDAGRGQGESRPFR